MYPALPRISILFAFTSILLLYPSVASITRDYSLVLSWDLRSPDGVLRSTIVINDQFPGPLIRGSVGDVLRINVTNLLDDSVSIHWHGIQQRNTPYMDGVGQLTQCPIPKGMRISHVG
jgi:hypothetical protein